jgi:protein SCO1
VRSRLLAIAAIAAATGLVAGCGGSSSSSGDAGTTASEHAGHATTGEFTGGTISPRRAAPPLVLKDVDGKTVDIRDYKGSPVLVTFVYAHCPDVCPLIMSNMRQARIDAGADGRKTKVIAVSVDPKGDTPQVVRTFLAQRRVAGFVHYLIGTRAELEPVWKDWNVATQVPKSDPELVEHTALIYGVTASGELATAYPVNFKASDIARDLPLLASS